MNRSELWVSLDARDGSEKGVQQNNKTSTSVKAVDSYSYIKTNSLSECNALTITFMQYVRPFPLFFASR
jgi:hypothetical protein